MRGGPTPPPAGPTLALLLAAAWMLAEYFRQRAIPSPAGVPGDGGLSVAALVGLGLVAWVGPALLASFLLRSRRRLAETAALAAATFPVAAAVSWRAADRLQLLHDPAAPGPPAFLLVGAALAVVFGAVAHRLALAWPARARLRPGVLAVAVVAGAVLVGLELGVPGTPVRARAVEGPNLLLVTIDALRPDALAAYGGEHPTALDSLDAVVHEAWAVSSWTQPSLASLFSGAAPTGHGSDRSHGPDPAVSWWTEQIAAERHAAFVTNPFLRRRFGFDRGFDRFDHAEERPWLEPVARTVIAEYVQAWLNGRQEHDRADRVVGRAVRWLEEEGAGGRWFLWVHLLDPHLPYVLRGPGGETAPSATPAWMQPLADQVGPEGFRELGRVRRGEAVQTAAERQALRRLYQTGADYAAWWARELIRAAEEHAGDRGLAWIVTSDHGEEFFENGGFEHGHSLEDAVLKVPFLSSGLGDGQRALRLSDVGPWVLANLGAGEGFDPARGTQLEPDDEKLREVALGRFPGPVSCGPPALLAEGMLYGPPRTLFVLADGTRVYRDDLSGDMRRVEGCGTGAGELAAPWTALDLWRERRTLSPRAPGMDDDLRRSLQSLGYIE